MLERVSSIDELNQAIAHATRDAALCCRLPLSSGSGCREPRKRTRVGPMKPGEGRREEIDAA